jgi:hypothetical protein
VLRRHPDPSGWLALPGYIISAWSIYLERKAYKSQTLVKGIVQLGVGVADLLLADECFETFAKTTHVSRFEILIAKGERTQEDHGGIWPRGT